MTKLKDKKMKEKKTLAELLKHSEERKHFVIKDAVIDPIFLKDNENFRNLKFNVAISIWFEEECSFKPLEEGGFLLQKPSGNLIFTKEEWSRICKKITVWIWGDDIYCTSEEMRDKLVNLGFITYKSVMKNNKKFF